jgi:hypothetical protein
LIIRITGEGVCRVLRGEDVAIGDEPVERRAAMDVFVRTQPEKPDDVGITLEQESKCLLEAV